MALFEVTFHPGGRGREMATSVAAQQRGVGGNQETDFRLVELERDQRRE